MSLKLELRNVRHSPSLSQETNAFTAVLYVDGRKAAEVRNAGQGGPTDVHFYPNARAEMQKVGRHLQATPTYTFPATKYAEAFSVPFTEEILADDLFEKWFAAKGKLAEYRKFFRQGKAVGEIAGEHGQILIVPLPENVRRLPAAGQRNFLIGVADREKIRVDRVYLPPSGEELPGHA
jgi:hypothetical protein